MDVIGWCGDEFGVTAVGVPAGVAGLWTEVFSATDTVSALTARVSEPCDADPVSDCNVTFCSVTDGDHFADDFMAGCDVRMMNRQVAFDNVQVGAADAAGPHGDQ